MKQVKKKAKHWSEDYRAPPKNSSIMQYLLIKVSLHNKSKITASNKTCPWQGIVESVLIWWIIQMVHVYSLQNNIEAKKSHMRQIIILCNKKYSQKM